MEKKLEQWITKHKATKVWEILGKPDNLEEFKNKIEDYYFNYSESVYWNRDKMRQKAEEDEISFVMMYKKAAEKTSQSHVELMRRIAYAKSFKQNKDENIINVFSPEDIEGKEDFNLCVENFYNSEKIFEICNNNMELYKKVRKNAKNFCLKNTGLSEDEYKKYIHRHAHYYKFEYKELTIPLYEILKSKDLELIVENTKKINEELKLEGFKLYSYIPIIKAFSINHPHPNPNDVSEILKRKIDRACQIIEISNKEEKIIEKQNKTKEREFQKEINKKELLQKSQEIITSFLNSGLSKKEYCEMFNIENHHFDKYVEILKEYDKELYENYNEYIEKSLAQGFKVIMIKLNQIINYIKNGIPINETDKRNFDLIDYYTITKIDLDDMKKIVSKAYGLNATDKKIFNTFVAQNSNISLKGVQAINSYYNTKISIGDRELQKEEKEMLVDYLKNNNIPINLKTITIVQKRYLSGYLNPKPQISKKI